MVPRNFEHGADPGSATVLPVEPSARTYTLADLVSRVYAGEVRVPHFQRGLRWGTADAVALIDSVLRGFPIGSLLLWKRPGKAERITLGRLEIDAPAFDDALFVVDGQQRLTTFANAFDPRAGSAGPFALVYDLKEKPFKVRARRAYETDSIGLPTLFDLGRLLRWTRDNPKYLDVIDDINNATTRLREFHVPAYEVRTSDDSALRDIYDRMNNAGRRLSRAEAFWGLFAPDEQELLEHMSLSTLQDHVSTTLGWGRIDDDTILRVFLARRGAEVTRDIHQEFDDRRRPTTDFAGESIQDAHRGSKEALERTVEFLISRAGVPHFTFLAYRFLLVVLTRFFAHFPEPDARNLDLLVKWYWRTALVGPSIAKGSATGAMRSLANCIDPSDENGSVQALLNTLRDTRRAAPDPMKYRSNYAESHIMLCAMWGTHPSNPDTGEPFTGVDLAVEIGSSSTPNSAVPELFPRSMLPDDLKSAIGNRLLMPGIPQAEIRAFAENEGLLSDGLLGERRQSHLLPREGLSSWDPDAAISIVRDRTERLAQVIADFLNRMTGDEHEDSPPLSSFDFDADDESELLPEMP